MFIAPNLAIPYQNELLDLQRKHSVVSLTTDVTRRLIHEEADRGKPFQVVHILVDDEIAFDEVGRSRMVITLPGGEVLDAEGVNYILKRAGGAALFCNSCFGAAIANYVALAGGAPWAVGNTLRVNIEDAWIAPSAFYQELAEQSIPDPWAAFRAIPPDLYYGYFVNLDDVSVIAARPVYREMTTLLARTTEMHKSITALQSEWQAENERIGRLNEAIDVWNKRMFSLMGSAIGLLTLVSIGGFIWQQRAIYELQAILTVLSSYLGGTLP